MVEIYGIRNCSTMKKAFDWLTERGIDFTFYNYKKTGFDEAVLRAAIKEHGLEKAINKRGLAWRRLDDALKKDIDEEGAIKIACEYPSVIKRPLLVVDGKTYLGFTLQMYGKIFKNG